VQNPGHASHGTIGFLKLIHGHGNAVNALVFISGNGFWISGRQHDLFRSQHRKMTVTWILPSCLLTNHGFRITLTDIDLMQAHEKPEKNR
jgi:hypothetical protein